MNNLKGNKVNDKLMATTHALGPPPTHLPHRGPPGGAMYYTTHNCWLEHA